jgi:hypothetical protein
MAECITLYHTAQYSDPLVLLPRSGYVYLKSDKASMGYCILRSSTNICAKLKQTTLNKSRVSCEQHAGTVCLTIDIVTGDFLVVQQDDSHGKKMWAALVKLKRWFRRFPQKYKLQVSMRTAVAMCLHERLGADLIELIARV